MKRLTDFILRERMQYPGEGNNLFAFSLGQAARYEFFLGLIADRHRQAGDEFKRLNAAFSDEMRLLQERQGPQGAVPIGEGSTWAKLAHQSQVVHLEIESFYLFAKIFLDHMARFIEFHFGKAQRMSLDSHDDLTKWFPKYAEAKRLGYSDDLRALLALLKESVSDYRDTEVAHAKYPRAIHMTTWGSDGEVRMARTNLYPKPNEVQKESESVSGLLVPLDSYIDRITALVMENRARSRHLQPRPGADGSSADPHSD